MKKIVFILALLLTTGAIGYTPPPDKLPSVIGPPVVDARMNLDIVGGGVATGEAPAPTNYITGAYNCLAAYFMTGTTTETDQKGNGNTLNQTSGTIPTDADVPSGYSGTSRLFAAGDTEDLESDTTSGSELHLDGDTPLTVTAWIKTSTDYAATVHIAGIYDTSGNQRSYRLGITSGEVAAFFISDDGTNYCGITGGTNVSSGSWVHIAGVFDAANDLMYLYVNGSSDATAVACTREIGTQSEEFSIGGFSAGSALMNGYIDEVGVFNYAMSSTQINDIKTNGLDGSKGGND
jgi:hypothetical protein